MNHKPKQTPSSYIAGLWFANYIKAKVIDAGESEKLATAIGMECKQIYKYASGEASPKLEVVANILAYYGDFDKVREAIGGMDFLKNEATTVETFTRAELESWLYQIAMNNLDGVERDKVFSDDCIEIINRLDGFEQYTKDKREGII